MYGLCMRYVCVMYALCMRYVCVSSHRAPTVLPPCSHGPLLETYWRPTGDRLETGWRPAGDRLETGWRPAGPMLAYCGMGGAKGNLAQIVGACGLDFPTKSASSPACD